MSAAKHTPGPLNDDCMSLLERHEVGAELLTGAGGSRVTLHDVDGDWLFTVHKDIHASDLVTMLTLRRNRFDAGFKAGREAAFSELRALLGVDAAIAKATGGAA